MMRAAMTISHSEIEQELMGYKARYERVVRILHQEIDELTRIIDAPIDFSSVEAAEKYLNEGGARRKSDAIIERAAYRKALQLISYKGDI